MAFRALIGRSLRAFAEDTSKVLKMEVAPTPKALDLISFASRPPLTDFAVGSDADLGGRSSASLSMTPHSTAVFSGNISVETPEGYRLERAGYAGFRNKARPPQLYGSRFWDVSLFSHLGLKVKGDSRRYHINIQTDGPIQSDVFQHRMYLKTPGEWEVVMIPFSNFILTNTGEAAQGRLEMLKERIRTVGVSVIDRMPGPFEIELEWIKALNHNSDHPELPRPKEGRSLDEGDGTEDVDRRSTR